MFNHSCVFSDKLATNKTLLLSNCYTVKNKTIILKFTLKKDHFLHLSRSSVDKQCVYVKM